MARCPRCGRDYLVSSGKGSYVCLACGYRVKVAGWRFKTTLLLTPLLVLGLIFLLAGLPSIGVYLLLMPLTVLAALKLRVKGRRVLKGVLLSSFAYFLLAILVNRVLAVASYLVVFLLTVYLPTLKGKRSFKPPIKLGFSVKPPKTGGRRVRLGVVVNPESGFETSPFYFPHPFLAFLVAGSRGYLNHYLRSLVKQLALRGDFCTVLIGPRYLADFKGVRVNVVNPERLELFELGIYSQDVLEVLSSLLFLQFERGEEGKLAFKTAIEGRFPGVLRLDVEDVVMALESPAGEAPLKGREVLMGVSSLLKQLTGVKGRSKLEEALNLEENVLNVVDTSNLATSSLTNLAVALVLAQFYRVFREGGVEKDLVLAVSDASFLGLPVKSGVLRSAVLDVLSWPGKGYCTLLLGHELTRPLDPSYLGLADVTLLLKCEPTREIEHYTATRDQRLPALLPSLEMGYAIAIPRDRKEIYLLKTP